MATSAIDAMGTLLKIGDGGGSETFTTIAEVRNISGPALAMDTVDATNHDSTGGWGEHIGTVLRGGEISFEINYLPANSTHDATDGLIADLQNKTLRNFQLVFSDAASTTWSFAALVTGFESDAPHDGALTASVTLLISGQPTLA